MVGYNRMYFFCLQIDGPITEGRGVISGSLWFKRTTGMTTRHLIRGHSSIYPDKGGGGGGRLLYYASKIIWPHLFSQNAILWVSLYPMNNFVDYPLPGPEIVL